ncbi:MAG: amidoligase family protein [Alphaproteobacteria bacterium]|nr:amidoligase family protein [Alphaproteobacteria bacterium]
MNPEGRPRCIGLELEYGNLDASRSATLVEERFGGRLECISDYKIKVLDTEFGDFTVELDLQILHEGDPDDPFRVFAAELGGTILPMEIACPPVPIADACRIDGLCDALREAGAEGTYASAFYAFGAQLNPELPSYEPDYVLSMLRAFVLLREALRTEIGIDRTRRLTSFASAHSSDWCRLILDPDYRPGMERLIDDYVEFNPSRSRELDMLPFFAWIDDARVRQAVPAQKINARPTFHYRLPNAMIDDPTWSVGLEWRRWLNVEALAERPDLIRRYSDLWIANADRFWAEDWTPRSTEVWSHL